MKKQFDEFQKLKIKDMCKAIQEMTYTYLNPTTGEPTIVPSKHYEQILNRTMEEFLEESIKLELFNTIFTQLNKIIEEYKNDVIKSLICIDKGLKPTNMTIAEQIALQKTFDLIQEKMKKEKKKFHLLDSEYIDYFDNILEDTDLHKQILNLSIDNTEQIEIQEQNDKFKFN